MPMRRTLVGSGFKTKLRKRTTGLKIGENVEILIFLGYLKFLKELSKEAKLLAHEEKLKSPTITHVNVAAERLLDKMNVENRQ